MEFVRPWVSLVTHSIRTGTTLWPHFMGPKLVTWTCGKLTLLIFLKCLLLFLLLKTLSVKHLTEKVWKSKKRKENKKQKNQTQRTWFLVNRAEESEESRSSNAVSSSTWNLLSLGQWMLARWSSRVSCDYWDSLIEANSSGKCSLRSNREAVVHMGLEQSITYRTGSGCMKATVLKGSWRSWRLPSCGMARRNAKRSHW